MASPHNKQSSSQAELKKAWYHGMHKFEHGIYAGIKSFYIAKVVKYDKSLTWVNWHHCTISLKLQVSRLSWKLFLACHK